MTNPRSWERLRKDEVSLVFGCREKHFPAVEDRSSELSIVAVDAIIRGLHAYGWTNHELAECGSRLMKLVGECVDLKELSHGRIEPLTPASNPEFSKNISTSPSVPEEGIGEIHSLGFHEPEHELTTDLPHGLKEAQRNERPQRQSVSVSMLLATNERELQPAMSFARSPDSLRSVSETYVYSHSPRETPHSLDSVLGETPSTKGGEIGYQQQAHKRQKMSHKNSKSCLKHWVLGLVYFHREHSNRRTTELG